MSALLGTIPGLQPIGNISNQKFSKIFEELKKKCDLVSCTYQDVHSILIKQID